jgi:pimeloyl-ACP methyl ester carboxylesterase
MFILIDLGRHTMNSKMKMIFLLLVLQLNCSLLFPTNNPIDSVYYLTGKVQSKNLLIMLPGRFEKMDTYMKHGFIENVKSSGIGFDIVAVDAHLGYYYSENLIPRLYDDVIVPARHKGYENIWIFGISLGGLGALWLGKDKGENIKGIIVIAPFVGDKEVIDEIKSAGGPAKWLPKEPLAREDYQRGLWIWLKKYAIGAEKLPRLIIGYGLEDEFAYGDDLLAQTIPKDQVFTGSGGHDWETWTGLFNTILKIGNIK